MGLIWARPSEELPGRLKTSSRWLDRYTKIQQPPPVKFKDLVPYSTDRLVRDQVKFDYRFDFLRVTSDTVLVPITVRFPRDN